jgi:hypothetical protein
MAVGIHADAAMAASIREGMEMDSKGGITLMNGQH